MPATETPTFLEKREDVWVTCASYENVSSMEIACTVEGVSQEKVVIAPVDLFDIETTAIRGVVVGSDGNGDRLVDLPSGARILVEKSKLRRR